MFRSNITKTLFFGLMITAFAACSDDDEKADYDKTLPTPTLPTVNTDAVEAFGTAAKATMTMTMTEGATVENQGFVVSTSTDASLSDESTTIVYVTGLVSGQPKTVAINDLEPGTTYYVKAFAYAPGGITYGETKEITATDDYERQTDYSADFSDMTAAAVEDFTTVKLGETVYPFTPVSLALLGWDAWGFSSSIFSPDLFETGSASLASYEEENILSYKADFTGKGFSQVWVQGISIASLFGDTYATYPGDFEVYISEEPITTAEELAAATQLGTVKFSTDPTADTYMLNDGTFDIPIEYDGVCYISIYNHSVYATNGNFGVIIAGFDLTSLHKK